MKSRLYCDECGQELNVKRILFGAEYSCDCCREIIEVKLKYRWLVMYIDVVLVLKFVDRVSDYYEISFLIQLIAIFAIAIFENIILFFLTPWLVKKKWIRLIYHS